MVSTQFFEVDIVITDGWILLRKKYDFIGKLGALATRWHAIRCNLTYRTNVTALNKRSRVLAKVPRSKNRPPVKNSYQFVPERKF